MFKKRKKYAAFFSYNRLGNPWVLWSLFSALLISIPLLIVFSSIISETDEVWLHISQQLLPGYAINTIILLIGVAIITFLIGLSTSWLVSMFDFPGRRFFAWALILPLSIPAYILGFTWAGILDFTSPVYVFLRNYFGINTGQFLFFNILSIPGAIVILSLALYPYVFLITRAYFSRQSSILFEAAESLGKKPGQVFLQVALPLSRPAFVAGVSLALMEVLNEYGLVRYFGVDTFTTGIFTAWFAFSNPQAALRLSAWLMIFVMLLLIAEKFQRRKLRYNTGGKSHRPAKITRLHSWRAALAVIICGIPFLFGFLFPVFMLVYWGIKTAPIVVNYRFLELLSNSFLLAGLASVTVVVFAVLISWSVRIFPKSFVKFIARVSTLGYALPGAVVAIGILVTFLWIDARLSSIEGQGFRIAITGTWLALIYAYLVRFMAVGYNSIESGMEKIPKSIDDASRSLGRSNLQTLWSITLPLGRASVVSALLLVFIDVLKELPLTLILRPFNFDTLAIRAFEFASDERVAEAAPAALIIILVGLIPAIVLNKIIEGKKNGRT